MLWRMKNSISNPSNHSCSAYGRGGGAGRGGHSNRCLALILVLLSVTPLASNSHNSVISNTSVRYPALTPH